MKCGVETCVEKKCGGYLPLEAPVSRMTMSLDWDMMEIRDGGGIGKVVVQCRMALISLRA